MAAAAASVATTCATCVGAATGVGFYIRSTRLPLGVTSSLRRRSRRRRDAGWSSATTFRTPPDVGVARPAGIALTLPYLTCWADACARQTPSAEATARAQCASPTDLKVDRTSWKLWQTSGGEANGCHSAYPMKE